jgi:hypothetical protein
MMGKVVKFVKPPKSKTTDPWCSQITLDDGTKVSGGAAREMRIKAVGGIDKLLRDTLEIATNIASKKAV